MIHSNVYLGVVQAVRVDGEIIDMPDAGELAGGVGTADQVTYDVAVNEPNTTWHLLQGVVPEGLRPTPPLRVIPAVPGTRCLVAEENRMYFVFLTERDAHNPCEQQSSPTQLEDPANITNG